MIVSLYNFRLYQVFAELVVINQADSRVLLKWNQDFLHGRLNKIFQPIKVCQHLVAVLSQFRNTAYRLNGTVTLCHAEEVLSGI